MINADFHMHSCYSGDSKAPTEDMIKESVNRGLKRICFTEHNDPDYVYVKPEETGMFDLKTEEYYKDILNFQNKYQNQIDIGFGVELGIQPGIYDKLSEYALSFPFDFIIASSHVCKKKDPYYPSYYDGISIKEGIRDYFEEILENVTHFNEYDIYGHLDYIVRYLPSDRKSEYFYNYRDFEDVIEAFLKIIIQNGKGIELNTSGYSKSICNSNPCPEIIRLYHELGGEIITIGADAHSPDKIAYCFDKVEETLIRSGFDYYCTFEGRKPVFHKL